MRTRSGGAAVFSYWHPHFTPGWLSKRLSPHLPSEFSGAVIDPACGAGNLLAAAALRTCAASRRSRDIEFVGADTSMRAVHACERLLTSLLPKGNFRIEKADFLRVTPATKLRPSAVVMNPPFCGYGLLSQSRRGQISRMEMKGRFNLAYAFVQRAIVQYRPEHLVSLLPSNWIHTRKSAFRSELDALNGRWEWEDVGDSAFEGIDIHVGILLWRPVSRVAVADRSIKPSEVSESTLEIRQGVATGRDELFCDLAESPLPFGRRVLAVRGRDIARGSATKIWIPPKSLTNSQINVFRRLVPRKALQALRARSCVVSKRRDMFRYHETPPAWFYGEPKVLLPEIATGKVRVELDIKGKKLPLHSVIAIRTKSAKVARELKRFLETSRVQRKLLTTGPRLAGGAVRLQVGTVRDALSNGNFAGGVKR